MNILKNERSPYLLQHAENPVDWMPWGENAFELAKKTGKPVFLSIGYSTCHWCHVMEKESFEDKEVADLLNRTFVCIKVDREERPDIDKIYMNIAQMITGRGGWPLSIFMTPDKKPFFAATYIPKEDRFGQVGLLTLIPGIDDLWNNKKDEIIESASTIVEKLSSIKERPGKNVLDYTVLDHAFNSFYGNYDRKFGGFGDAPKFPSTHNLSFILHYWKRSKNPDALKMVTNTLDSMRYGGLWDHIGHGFHRYSTDRQWKIPHFEKMLYDQAIISMTYIDAYQATGKILYRETAEQIFDYVINNISSSGGGFFSAEDADSEGVEGKFYVWTKKELEGYLEKDEADFIFSSFSIEDSGNFKDEATGKRTGNNIFYMNGSFESLSEKYGMDFPSFKRKLFNILAKLNIIRARRIRPFRDEKILTDWNGLMVSAFARGGRVFGIKEYIEIAEKTVRSLFRMMSAPGGRLYHNNSRGISSIEANLDDYSFMILALLELYQSTFKYEYIKKAESLDLILDKFFWDDTLGGYYYIPSDNKDLILRQKESYDGALPSGNSVAMSNLIKLGRIKMDRSLEEKGLKTAEAFSRSIADNPMAHSQFLIALDFLLGDSYEIILVKGRDEGMVDKMAWALNKNFIPNKVVILSDGNRDLPKFIKKLDAIDGKTTAYVCKNYYCKLPTSSISQMLKLLDINSKRQ